MKTEVCADAPELSVRCAAQLNAAKLENFSQLENFDATEA